MTQTKCEELVEAHPGLPESSQKVLCELTGGDPLTGKDLRDRTGLPRRTLYTALQRLQEAGAIEARTSLRDSRQTYYWLADPKPQLGHEKPHPYAQWSERALAAAST